MRFNRKVIESAAVGIVTMMMVATASVAPGAGTKAEQYTRQEMTEEAEVLEATKERIHVEVVAASKEAVEEATEETAEETVAEAAEKTEKVKKEKKAKKPKKRRKRKMLRRLKRT